MLIFLVEQVLTNHTLPKFTPLCPTEETACGHAQLGNNISNQLFWLSCYTQTLREMQIKVCHFWMIELEHVIKKDNEYVKANIRLWLLLSSRGNIELSAKQLITSTSLSGK